MRVALFITCFNDTLFPSAGRAVVEVLERVGCTVEFPLEQTCCGQMHFNSGYAHEAVSAALAWSDQRFARTVCIIDPENTPSLKLADRLGYREFSRAVFKDAPIILLERNA